MNTKHKRMLLFLTGCIGSRLGLVYIAYRNSGKALSELLGALALLPAIGFFYIYLTGGRKTGPEVFGDRIWWNSLRPFHGLLWALFAVLALFRVPWAWVVLLVDVLVGLVAFIAHHSGANIPAIQ